VRKLAACAGIHGLITAPLVQVCCTGGARMQEGTSFSDADGQGSAVAEKLHNAGIPASLCLRCLKLSYFSAL
jgi:acetyl-CoA carboxylase beta subunit